MSDEFWLHIEQQEALRKLVDPLNELRLHIDPLKDLHKQLGIGAATMDLLRQEEARRKMLSGLVGLGSLAEVVNDYERQYKMLMGPVEEARRLGLFDSQLDISKSISVAIEEQQNYARLFRLPEVSELSRIAHEVMGGSGLARTLLGTEDSLQAAMATMSSPWLQIEGGFTSAKAFSEIIAIGHGIDSVPAFDHDLTASLRSGLGDWRDMQTPEPEPLFDPVLRSELYVERGFDLNLTDFTTSAFDEGIRIAGLRDAESTGNVDGNEDGFARAKRAFGQLLRFEVVLRRFIERVMQAEFGEAWVKRQLPSGMLDTWVDKRDKALKAGHAEQPLIDYADFTDYKAIIERKDNWRTVFKPVFGREEDVRESFQRLYPVRIATMHARLITQDDELLLLVETKRVIKAISAK